jgi:hypothetical protein
MKQCFRSLNKPITLLGLDIEELAIILMFTGILVVIFNIIIALSGSILAGLILKKTKKGRYPGFFKHWLYYHTGIKFKGLLPSPKKQKAYTIWKKDENYGKSGRVQN